ncbi:hypothetical protein BaRGS_00016482 [Batillaria attramentaria]|uniref:Uncharacterized protein n=1 Tax=Batillaria attramentaria TaxID=370345 RepID=A0ABD0KZU6_9CAEN
MLQSSHLGPGMARDTTLGARLQFEDDSIGHCCIFQGSPIGSADVTSAEVSKDVHVLLDVGSPSRELLSPSGYVVGWDDPELQRDCGELDQEIMGTGALERQGAEGTLFDRPSGLDLTLQEDEHPFASLVNCSLIQDQVFASGISAEGSSAPQERDIDSRKDVLYLIVEETDGDQVLQCTIPSILGVLPPDISTGDVSSMVKSDPQSLDNIQACTASSFNTLDTTPFAHKDVCSSVDGFADAPQSETEKAPKRCSSLGEDNHTKKKKRRTTASVVCAPFIQLHEDIRDNAELSSYEKTQTSAMPRDSIPDPLPLPFSVAQYHGKVYIVPDKDLESTDSDNHTEPLSSLSELRKNSEACGREADSKLARLAKVYNEGEIPVKSQGRVFFCKRGDVKGKTVHELMQSAGIHQRREKSVIVRKKRKTCGTDKSTAAQNTGGRSGTREPSGREASSDRNDIVDRVDCAAQASLVLDHESGETVHYDENSEPSGDGASNEIDKQTMPGACERSTFSGDLGIEENGRSYADSFSRTVKDLECVNVSETGVVCHLLREVADHVNGGRVHPQHFLQGLPPKETSTAPYQDFKQTDLAVAEGEKQCMENFDSVESVPPISLGDCLDLGGFEISPEMKPQKSCKQVSSVKAGTASTAVQAVSDTADEQESLDAHNEDSLIESFMEGIKMSCDVLHVPIALSSVSQSQKREPLDQVAITSKSLAVRHMCYTEMKHGAQAEESKPDAISLNDTEGWSHLQSGLPSEDITGGCEKLARSGNSNDPKAWQGCSCSAAQASFCTDSKSSGADSSLNQGADDRLSKAKPENVRERDRKHTGLGLHDQQLASFDIDKIPVVEKHSDSWEKQRIEKGRLQDLHKIPFLMIVHPPALKTDISRGLASREGDVENLPIEANSEILCCNANGQQQESDTSLDEKEQFIHQNNSEMHRNCDIVHEADNSVDELLSQICGESCPVEQKDVVALSPAALQLAGSPRKPASIQISASGLAVQTPQKMLHFDLTEFLECTDADHHITNAGLLENADAGLLFSGEGKLSPELSAGNLDLKISAETYAQMYPQVSTACSSSCLVSPDAESSDSSVWESRGFSDINTLIPTPPVRSHAVHLDPSFSSSKSHTRNPGVAVCDLVVPLSMCAKEIEQEIMSCSTVKAAADHCRGVNMVESANLFCRQDWAEDVTAGPSSGCLITSQPDLYLQAKEGIYSKCLTDLYSHLQTDNGFDVDLNPGQGSCPVADVSSAHSSRASGSPDPDPLDVWLENQPASLDSMQSNMQPMSQTETTMLQISAYSTDREPSPIQETPFTWQPHHEATSDMNPLDCMPRLQEDPSEEDSFSYHQKHGFQFKDRNKDSVLSMILNTPAGPAKIMAVGKFVLDAEEEAAGSTTSMDDRVGAIPESRCTYEMTIGSSEQLQLDEVAISPGQGKAAHAVPISTMPLESADLTPLTACAPHMLSLSQSAPAIAMAPTVESTQPLQESVSGHLVSKPTEQRSALTFSSSVVAPPPTVSVSSLASDLTSTSVQSESSFSKPSLALTFTPPSTSPTPTVDSSRKFLVNPVPASDYHPPCPCHVQGESSLPCVPFHPALLNCQHLHSKPPALVRPGDLQQNPSRTDHGHYEYKPSARDFHLVRSMSGSRKSANSGSKGKQQARILLKKCISVLNLLQFTEDEAHSKSESKLKLLLTKRKVQYELLVKRQELPGMGHLQNHDEPHLLVVVSIDFDSIVGIWGHEDQLLLQLNKVPQMFIPHQRPGSSGAGQPWSSSVPKTPVDITKGQLFIIPYHCVYLESCKYEANIKQHLCNNPHFQKILLMPVTYDPLLRLPSGTAETRMQEFAQKFVAPTGKGIVCSYTGVYESHRPVLFCLQQPLPYNIQHPKSTRAMHQSMLLRVAVTVIIISRRSVTVLQGHHQHVRVMWKEKYSYCF